MCITYLFEAQIYIGNFFYLLVHFPMATFVAGPGWSRKQELHLGLPRDTVTQGVTSSSASWGFSREMNWMCCSQDSSCCPSWDVGIAGAGLIHYATVLAPGTCCWSPQVGMDGCVSYQVPVFVLGLPVLIHFLRLHSGGRRKMVKVLRPLPALPVGGVWGVIQQTEDLCFK